jgi:ribonuclease D
MASRLAMILPRMTDPHPSPHPLLITDPQNLEELVARLRAGTRVAVDTEAASFHRYVDRVYLIQVSSDRETALVDPLAIPDPGAIGLLLADAGIEVIFHDADYDLRMLDRDYGFRARRIWDTRIAAQLAGEQSFGLSALLERFFGMRLSKKLQRADWSVRPLTDEMIAYAAADTAHLPALRDLLADRLRALDRLHWAEEEFRRLEQVRWNDRAGGDAFLDLKGAKLLKPPQLAVLRALWSWREQTAQALDRAPFRILVNELLVGLARLAPRTGAALAAVPGMPASIARRYGDELLAGIALGLATPEAEWPRIKRRPRTRPDPDVDARFQRLRELRAVRAPAIGLDPGLVCANGVLQEIARAAPQLSGDLDAIPELRRWQREVLGDEAILRAVRPA